MFVWGRVERTRYFDWAMLATTSAHHVLVIRRLISRPDPLAYFICYVPELRDQHSRDPANQPERIGRRLKMGLPSGLYGN